MLAQLLDAIGQSLSQIKDDFHKFIETTTKYQQSAEADRQKSIADPTIRLPVEIPEYYRSEQGDRRTKNFREKLRIGLEIAGIVLALAVAIITGVTLRVFYRQLKESQIQTRIFRDQAAQAKNDAASQLSVIKDQFRIDQRPTVWVSGFNSQHLPFFQVVQVAPPDGPKQALVNLYYFNYGKSPTYVRRTSRSIRVIKNASAHIQPGPWKHASEVISNGGEDFLAIVTPPLTPDELSNMQNDEWIAFMLRIQYADSADSLYETDICMSRLKTGAWSYCDIGNEIKDCSKEKCDEK